MRDKSVNFMRARSAKNEIQISCVKSKGDINTENPNLPVFHSPYNMRAISTPNENTHIVV